MKPIQMKPTRLLLSCLIYFAFFNSAQAQMQSSVTVKSYAQHVGSNTVYTYRVTNHGPSRLFSFNIGCNCTNADDPQDSEPQLVIYPVGYDFEKEFGGNSASGYAAPTGWKGNVAHYEDISYISFNFQSIWGSGISLLPGHTETFSIITPTKDDRDYFSLYMDRSEGAAFFYDKNKHGYLKGHYSYRAQDATGQTSVYSFPMQLIDTTPPILTLTSTPVTLWPPNGELIPITAALTVKDDYDPQPEIKLESITSSEVLEAGEIQGAQPGTDDRQFNLAATREGANLAGRVYTLTYSATDASGNKSTASTTVTVPHDQQ